ncbi:MAG: cell division protein ZapA [Clostridiaceae bacterium]|nr:cell division protein ZapA [Clostridiaceae bacterium]
MSSKTKVKVYIYGKEYTIVGEEPDYYIQKIASYIDKKMNMIYSLNNNLSTSMVAVLTAINVADEYFKCQEELEQLKKDMNEHIQLLERTSFELKKQQKENDELRNTIEQLKLDLVRKETELMRENARDNTVKINSARKFRVK